METEKSQDPACAEVSKANNQSSALASGILKYRSRSQGKAGLIEGSSCRFLMLCIYFNSLKVRWHSFEIILSLFWKENPICKIIAFSLLS